MPTPKVSVLYLACCFFLVLEERIYRTKEEDPWGGGEKESGREESGSGREGERDGGRERERELLETGEQHVPHVQTRIMQVCVRTCVCACARERERRERERRNRGGWRSWGLRCDMWCACRRA